jgi:ABC-2 type transport system ATP-binding protein
VEAEIHPGADDGGREPAHAGDMITNSLEVATAARTAPAITAHGVRKRYGDRDALDGVDLTVRRGELLALLGPNGAGKTTLVEILEGHRRADAGELDVLGFDPARRDRAFRERIGIVLQQEGLDPAITVREAIELYSAAYSDPRPPDEVLALVGLGDRAGARADTLSGGQRRRLDLALGIAGNPELLFLDEPTTGFDPSARRQSWAMIEGLRSLGTTIVLTTHYLDEAQHLADRVVVLAEGRVIADGPPDALTAGPREFTVTFRLPGEGGPPLPLGAVVEDGWVRLTTPRPTAQLAPMIAWAAERGVELEDLTVTRPDLEDVYLELIA